MPRMQYITCFGDSLTEFGFGGNWVSRLAQDYIRRANVINCGLAGYNTRWYLDVLQDPQRRPLLLPEFVQEPLFATLLLGSNDLASNEQGVPVEEFVANMHAILAFIHTEVKPRHGIFVMTPPPINDEAWRVFKQHEKTNRTLAGSRLYRSAVLDIVADCQAHHPEYGVQLVDTHSAILHHANPATALQAAADPSWEPTYDPQAPWAHLLVDGLHVNEVGGEIIYATLREAMRRSPGAGQLDPPTMAYLLPGWMDVAAALKQQP